MGKSSSKKRPWMSEHALQRARQRLGSQGRVGAMVRLKEEHRISIGIPFRHGQQRWSNREHITRQRSRASYRFSPNAVLIYASGRIVTTWEATHDDLATVLVWLMTGLWIDEPDE